MFDSKDASVFLQMILKLWFSEFIHKRNKIRTNKVKKEKEIQHKMNWGLTYGDHTNLDQEFSRQKWNTILAKPDREQNKIELLQSYWLKII